MARQRNRSNKGLRSLNKRDWLAAEACNNIKEGNGMIRRERRLSRWAAIGSPIRPRPASMAGVVSEMKASDVVMPFQATDIGDEGMYFTHNEHHCGFPVKTIRSST